MADVQRSSLQMLPHGWEKEVQSILESLKGANGGELDPIVCAPYVHTLKLGFQLALRERDSLLEENQGLAQQLDVLREGSCASTKLFEDYQDAATCKSGGTSDSMAGTLDSFTASSPKLNNRETEVNCTHHHTNNLLAAFDGGKSVPSPKFRPPYTMSEMLIEPVDEENSERSTWDYRTVTLTRVPGYGFGIAVSGGKDNPHFKSGDPSIVISDVLRAGPAFGVLQVNDRIVSANGIALDNADYSTAVQIMKESEQMNLIIKRRVPIPALEYEQRTLKFTLTKSKRKDDFGIVLGCKFYIKDISNRRLAEKEPGLKDGDVVLKINGQSCDELTLADARKLLDRSREKLSLVIQRDVPRGSTWRWPSSSTLYERLGTETPQSSHQSPRASPAPMSASRHSEYGGRSTSNTMRLSGRYNRLASSDYVGSPTQRSSVGSNPPSRSRTPSHSLYDEYPQTFSQRQSASNTPPPVNFVPGTADEMPSSPIAHKPPLPVPLPEPRYVSFRKEGGSVGVRVIGGNEVGIFVSAVQAGSPAAAKGVRAGDKILRVNNRDMKGVTREEAVLFLLSLQEHVDLILQGRKEDFDRVRQQNMGDNFYIRTHFDYEKPEIGEMAFRKGDLFQVVDTLHGGTVGSWQVIRVSSPSLTASLDVKSPPSWDGAEPPQTKGVVPNASRAEQIASAETYRQSRALSSDQKSATLFRRKLNKALGDAGRRSKSLTKGHWDEVMFNGSSMKYPAYERVKLKQPEFLRPIVLYGPIADVAREQLLRDFPLRFSAPRMENDDETKATTGIMRLSAIKEVMGKNKHCVLDIMPESVERLQYAQYCPIVVYLNVDSRSRLRELRRRFSKQAASKNTRKLLDHAVKLQKMYSYLFTAVLDASQEDRWFEALRELISHLQERRVWMSETKPADIMDDDFLFPMSPGSGNYSSFAGGDSDADSNRGEQSDLGGTSASSQVHTPNEEGLFKSYSEAMVIGNRAALPNGVHGMAQPPGVAHRQHSQQMNRRSPTPYDRLTTLQAPVMSPPVLNQSSPSVVSSNSQRSSTVASSCMPDQSTVSAKDDVPAVANGLNGHVNEDMYENRESLLNHYATLRLAAQRRVKPKPPPRSSCPPVPPKPRLVRPPAALVAPAAFGCTPVVTNPCNNGAVPLSQSNQNHAASKPDGAALPNHDYNGASPLNVGAPSTVAVLSPDQVPYHQHHHPQQQHYGNTGADVGYDVMSPPYSAPPLRQGAGYSRHYSEPGYYDVKQILADHSDDYHTQRNSAVPPGYVGVSPSYAMHYNPRSPGPMHSQPLSPRYADSQPRYRSQLQPIIQNRPFSPSAMPQQHVQFRYPPVHQPPFDDASLPSQSARTHNVSRTASMPPAPARQQQQLQPDQGQLPGRFAATAAYGNVNMQSQVHSRPLPISYAQPPSPAPHTAPSKSPRTPPLRTHELTPVTFVSTAVNAVSPIPFVDDERSTHARKTPSSSGEYDSGKESLVERSSGESRNGGRIAVVSVEDGYQSGSPKMISPSPRQRAPIAPPRGTSRTPSGSALELTSVENAHKENGVDILSNSRSHGGSAFDLYKKAGGDEPYVNGTMDGSTNSQLHTDDELPANHTVVEEVRGKMGPQGGTLSSKESGVSIIVPPGALEKDEEIYFKVCRDDTLTLPLDKDKGERLLSPLVMCGPHGLKFNKPVELKLPHSAASEGESGQRWSFALKSSSPGDSNDNSWKNVSLSADQPGGARQQGHMQERIVSVLIDHF